MNDEPILSVLKRSLTEAGLDLIRLGNSVGDGMSHDDLHMVRVRMLRIARWLDQFDGFLADAFDDEEMT